MDAVRQKIKCYCSSWQYSSNSYMHRRHEPIMAPASASSLPVGRLTSVSMCARPTGRLLVYIHTRDHTPLAALPCEVTFTTNFKLLPPYQRK